ncbi:MAG: flagellar biosynthesis protein FlhA [Spirochaetales bacterium]|nr:flagellar biosynthesis protein FlhA [Spirochaetales bacterium]
MADAQRVFGFLTKTRSDIIIAIFVIVIVMMLLIPLPAFMLDAFMAVNLVLSLMIILIVLFTRRALDFSVFPTLLLIVTVFSLSLNVSSTRLILSKGQLFDGQMIRAFAQVVTGSSDDPQDMTGYVIGLIIFIVIIAVQFVVITKGATRVAEVAARFTLDALPGKQMAIEAEYNSGLITEEEATRRKNDLQREVDFYGAMDGASKFVSGNVKVGIFITLINMIGGFIVGMSIHGESFNNAIHTYIGLTIGDGLVTQLPALLISTATGIIVTRSVSDATFGKDITKQFSAQSKPYLIAAAFLFLLGFVPGFPTLTLWFLAGGAGFLAFVLSRKLIAEDEKIKTKEAAAKGREAPAEISPVVPLDPISLELGYGLIPLVDKEHGAELLDRITRIRREAALDLGLVVPRIRIIDNMRLEPPEYCFKIKGVEVGKGRIRMGSFLAINPSGIEEEIPGEDTLDPTFGLPAKWISEETRERAEQIGYTVVDPPSIVATHLTEIIRQHSSEILGRQEVQSMITTLKQDYPAVVDEVTKQLSTGEIQKVLQGLLDERVSIRNIVVILETLADYSSIAKDLTFLIEKCRQSLGRQICLQFADENKSIRVMTLHPDLERKLIDSSVETGKGVAAALEPVIQRKWITACINSVEAARKHGHTPIILCSEAARPLVKSSTKRDLPMLVVLSVPEVANDMKIESLGEIKIEM